MSTSWLGAFGKKRVSISNLFITLLGILIIAIAFFDYLFMTDRPLPVVDIPFFSDLKTAPGFLNNIVSFDGVNLNQPSAVAVSKDNLLYVADSGNNRILVFNRQGEPIRQFGSPGTAKGQLDYPYALAVDTNNNVYVGQFRSACIQVFSSDGTFVRRIDQTSVGQLVAPLAMTFSNGVLYVANQDGKILEFTPQGKLLRAFAGAGSGQGFLSYPRGITVVGDKIYVVDTNDLRVEVFSTAGKFLQLIDKTKLGLQMPSGITVDPAGDLLVVDSFGSGVAGYDTDFNPLFVFGTRGNGDGDLNFPLGIAGDEYGRVYVADTANNRVAVFQW